MATVIAEHPLSSGRVLRAIQGDLTTEAVDAIVNAANSQLVHGGGLAAAIVRAGGSGIETESQAWVREHGPVTHAEPALTGPGSLPCGAIIHAVGPRWGEGDEDAKLQAAVSGSLRVADTNGLASLALPAISTGIFGFPVERAARLSIDAVLGHFRDHPQSPLSEIRFTNLDPATAEVFAAEFEGRWPGSRTPE